MIHYVCLGTCHGVSNRPAPCADELCPRYGKPMSECNCTNKGHREALKKLDEEDREEELD